MRRGKNLGRSIRTARYRYVEWTNQQGKLAAREFYDYQLDPDESRNLADMLEYKELVSRHAALLESGWQGALPE